MYPDWKSLPEDILNSVFKRIESPSYYLRCSVVCKSWYRVAHDNRIQQAKMMSNSHHPPMLLFPAEEEDTWNLYNMMERKVIDMQVTVPPNYKRFSGSSKGWLIALDENFVVTLINPFTRVKGRRAKENSIIRLPPLTHQLSTIKLWGKLYHHYLTRTTISADPILYPDDCIVVIVFQELHELAFLRLNKDTSWTYITGEMSLKVYHFIHDVVNIQNKFYVLNRWDKLLSFDISDDFHSDVELVMCGGHDQEKFLKNRYLLYSEDNREWLVVHSFIAYEEGCDIRETIAFRVFGLDLERFEWIEKKTYLGGISIFLGNNSSIAVLGSKFPGCRPNQIYFNHDYDGHCSELPPHDYGVYNFKTKNFKKCYGKKVRTQLERSKRYPIWIVPTFHM